MPETTGGRHPAAAHAQAHDGIDWEAIERTPEFRRLVGRRRRFVVPAGIFFMAFFLTYLLLAALAKDFMATDVAGVPLGWLIAMAQVFMAWIVGWLYLREAEHTLEPLERQAAEQALNGGSAASPNGGERR